MGIEKEKKKVIEIRIRSGKKKEITRRKEEKLRKLRRRIRKLEMKITGELYGD